MSDTYEKLITLLDANKASYRLIDHAPEGQTDKVSALRGHPVEAAAKCIVLIVKIGRKTSRFILAVVPGNARVARDVLPIRKIGRDLGCLACVLIGDPHGEELRETPRPIHRRIEVRGVAGIGKAENARRRCSGPLILRIAE